MIGYQNNAQSKTCLLLTEKVLKTVTEGKIFFNLTELIFIGDSIVLYIDLSFFPLSPYFSQATTSFFVSATVFFDHGEFSVNIPLEDVIKFNEICKMLILQDLKFLAKNVEIFDEMLIFEEVFVGVRDNVGDDSLNFFNKFIKVLMLSVIVDSFEKL